MQKTLSYFVTVLRKDFLGYTTQALQTLGLTFGQLPFIVYVGKCPGCTPSELRAHLGLDWGHSQRSITRLAEDGFLCKQHAPGGGRTYHLTLTPRGQEAFEAAHRVFHTWDDLHLSSLDPEEREALLAILEKLVAARPVQVPTIPEN